MNQTDLIHAAADIRSRAIAILDATYRLESAALASMAAPPLPATDVEVGEMLVEYADARHALDVHCAKWGAVEPTPERAQAAAPICHRLAKAENRLRDYGTALRDARMGNGSGIERADAGEVKDAERAGAVSP
jgi:hypothetical protein